MPYPKSESLRNQPWIDECIQPKPLSFAELTGDTALFVPEERYLQLPNKNKNPTKCQCGAEITVEDESYCSDCN